MWQVLASNPAFGFFLACLVLCVLTGVEIFKMLKSE